MSPWRSPGWRKDFDEASELSKKVDPVSRAIVVTYKYCHTIPIVALQAGADVVREID